MDEIYLAKFPEVADEPARPGSKKWRGFYSPFSRDSVAYSTMRIQQLMNWPTRPEHTRSFPRTTDVLADLDAMVSGLDKPIGRDSSRERPLLWNDLPAEEAASKEGECEAEGVLGRGVEKEVGEKEAVAETAAATVEEPPNEHVQPCAEEPPQQQIQQEVRKESEQQQTAVRRAKRLPRRKKLSSPNPYKRRRSDKLHAPLTESSEAAGASGTLEPPARSRLPSMATGKDALEEATDGVALQYIKKLAMGAVEAVAKLAEGPQKPTRREVGAEGPAAKQAQLRKDSRFVAVVAKMDEAMQKERYQRTSEVCVLHSVPLILCKLEES